MPVGTVDISADLFQGPTGYNSYVSGHPIPGLSYMADGTYIKD